MTQDTQKIWSLYKITNSVNGKIYIGQTVEPTKRWYQHRRDAANPKYPFHHAINKYGVHNFEFEVIACCTNQDDANYSEELLIQQYDSLVQNGKGYNVALGGSVAPKSEAWKQALQDWRDNLSEEEKAAINKKRSYATIQQIETQGHPSLGKKRTPEQLAKMSTAQQNRTWEYTDEVRKNMSEAHIGIKDTEETKQRKSESAKLAWEERIDYDELKCATPGCEVKGKAQYKIVDGIRYCSLHGQRLANNGTFERLPAFKYTDDNPMPDEVRKKCGAANIGRTPINKIVFSKEQIDVILSDPRSSTLVAKDFGVSKKIIQRVRKENRSAA
jgi:group I intron endonuclease